MLNAIDEGDDFSKVAKELDGGGEVDWINPDCGLPLLHYAVGRNRKHIVRILLERGATVGPDAHGRWPSILALQCECDDEICDMIEAAEERVAPE